MSQIGCVVEGTIAPKSNYSATSMLIAIASCSPRLTQPPISSVHSREEWIGIKEIAHDRLEHKKRMKRERIDKRLLGLKTGKKWDTILNDNNMHVVEKLYFHNYHNLESLIVFITLRYCLIFQCGTIFFPILFSFVMGLSPSHSRHS